MTRKDMDTLRDRGFRPGDLFHYPKHRAWGVMIEIVKNDNPFGQAGVMWKYNLTSPSPNDPEGPAYTSIKTELQSRFMENIASGNLQFIPVKE